MGATTSTTRATNKLTADASAKISSNLQTEASCDLSQSVNMKNCTYCTYGPKACLAYSVLKEGNKACDESPPKCEGKTKDGKDCDYGNKKKTKGNCPDECSYKPEVKSIECRLKLLNQIQKMDFDEEKYKKTDRNINFKLEQSCSIDVKSMSNIQDDVNISQDLSNTVDQLASIDKQAFSLNGGGRVQSIANNSLATISNIQKSFNQSCNASIKQNQEYKCDDSDFFSDKIGVYLNQSKNKIFMNCTQDITSSSKQSQVIDNIVTQKAIYKEADNMKTLLYVLLAIIAIPLVFVALPLLTALSGMGAMIITVINTILSIVFFPIIILGYIIKKITPTSTKVKLETIKPEGFLEKRYKEFIALCLFIGGAYFFQYIFYKLFYLYVGRGMNPYSERDQNNIYTTEQAESEYKKIDESDMSTLEKTKAKSEIASKLSESNAEDIIFKLQARNWIPTSFQDKIWYHGFIHNDKSPIRTGDGFKEFFITNFEPQKSKVSINDLTTFINTYMNKYYSDDKKTLLFKQQHIIQAVEVIQGKKVNNSSDNVIDKKTIYRIFIVPNMGILKEDRDETWNEYEHPLEKDKETDIYKVVELVKSSHPEIVAFSPGRIIKDDDINEELNNIIKDAFNPKNECINGCENDLIQKKCKELCSSSKDEWCCYKQYIKDMKKGKCTNKWIEQDVMDKKKKRQINSLYYDRTKDSKNRKPIPIDKCSLCPKKSGNYDSTYCEQKYSTRDKCNQDKKCVYYDTPLTLGSCTLNPYTLKNGKWEVSTWDDIKSIKNPVTNANYTRCGLKGKSAKDPSLTYENHYHMEDNSIFIKGESISEDKWKQNKKQWDLLSEEIKQKQINLTHTKDNKTYYPWILWTFLSFIILIGICIFYILPKYNIVDYQGMQSSAQQMAQAVPVPGKMGDNKK